ncbi:MAG: Txe/YoeB family addiction module toxin [bacterium]
MRTVVFEKDAFHDFVNWAATDKSLFERLLRLISETAKNPFEGIGKPEPLKHQLQGYWSRRINDEHRLVYKVKDDSIIIVACKWHY